MLVLASWMACVCHGACTRAPGVRWASGAASLKARRTRYCKAPRVIRWPSWPTNIGASARSAFDELTEKWGQRYPAVIRLWDDVWNEVIPFLDYDVEIRRVICSTNDRIVERPLPARDQSPRPLPLQAGRDEVSVSGHAFARPDRSGQGTMDNAVEASAQRVRDHIRRPIPGSRNLLMETAGNTDDTDKEIVPTIRRHRGECFGGPTFRRAGPAEAR